MGDGNEAKVEISLQKGEKKYQVIADSVEWTIADVKQALNDQANLNVDVKFIKVLLKGRIRGNEETLKDIKVKPPKIKGKLLFEEGYHHQVAGSLTLEKAETQLAELEKSVKELYTKVNHRMCTPEDASFEMVYMDDAVQNIKGALDESKVKPEEKETRDNMFERLKTVLEKLDAIKEANRVYR